jgi:ABC-type bacteriocin/lantibiotic exporter with double-glycine peptidase domain
LESNINLVYSIYTKNLGDIFSMLKNNEFYPIILYNRKYNISMNSYNNIFNGNISYYNWRLFIIIFGSICTAIFIGLAIMFHLKNPNQSNLLNSFDGKINENLIPSTFERDSHE